MRRLVKTKWDVPALQLDFPNAKSGFSRRQIQVAQPPACNGDCRSRPPAKRWAVKHMAVAKRIAHERAKLYIIGIVQKPVGF
tara:strand:+ start:381 stop:626 length:246 start_codon:yes stop_codon:yes gene_type:complete